MNGCCTSDLHTLSADVLAAPLSIVVPETTNIKPSQSQETAALLLALARKKCRRRLQQSQQESEEKRCNQHGKNIDGQNWEGRASRKMNGYFNHEALLIANVAFNCHMLPCTCCLLN